jgi:hypothetical protein
MLLGALGLFLGINVNISLPPILGVIPLAIGIGTCFPLIKWMQWRKRVDKCTNCGKERFDLKPGQYECTCGNKVNVIFRLG